MRLLRRSLRAKLLGPIKRNARRGALAVQIWISPEANPFLQRALRVEIRKNRPLLTLLGAVMLGILLAVILYLGWLWWPIVNWPYTPRPSTVPPVALPRSVGSNLIGFTAIMAAGACGYTAFYATRARAAYLLRQEVVKSTLDGLQLLPFAEERWVWMMSTHPTLLSLLIGAAGLPFYALAVWTQQWSPLDLVGLFLIFLAIGHVAPMWQPLMWKGVGKGRANQKVDWKTLQESMRLARAEGSMATLSPAQQLEAQRRNLRTMSGLDTPLAPPTDSAKSTQKDAIGTSAVAEGAVATQTTPTQTASNRGGCAIGASVWMGIQFLNVVLRFGGANPLVALWQDLRASLPPNVTSLFGLGVLFSWPLLLGRIVTTPLPFFSFVLPPAILLVPLWIGFARVRVWGLASQVSASETFWTTRRARERKGVAALLWLLSGFLVAGYSWQALIDGGALCSVLVGSAALTVIGSPSWALAAAWTVATVVGAVVASQALENPFTPRGYWRTGNACGLAHGSRRRSTRDVLGHWALFRVLLVRFAVGYEQCVVIAPDADNPYRCSFLARRLR
jgi:hypothetical protein